MKIPISELRRINLQLLDHLENCGHSLIEVDVDFYWTIKKEELYDPYKKPEALGLGQLYDEYEFLKNIIEGKSEPTAYALVWLSAVLRYIGEKIVF
jgi:hypothetical protein